VELSRFLQHYERISRRALRSLAGKADVVLSLDERRRVHRR
jgi:D-glycerate 3-kinase